MGRRREGVNIRVYIVEDTSDKTKEFFVAIEKMKEQANSVKFLTSNEKQLVALLNSN